MQRLIPLILIFMLGGTTYALGDDNLLQTANQIYHLSEEMVFHGSEGHAHEIIDNGEKMIIEIDRLSRDMKKMGSPQLQKSLMATRKITESAIKFGKQGNLLAALASAKSASFQAKKVRQALR
jgi:hypothetical protein